MKEQTGGVGAPVAGHHREGVEHQNRLSKQQ